MSSLTTLWLVLIATQDCNLRCKYCYVNGGDLKNYMNANLARNFIHGFLNKYRGVKELVITFFGGEPALNFNLVNKIIVFCEELPVKTRFRISTNGMCDKNIWQYLANKNFSIALSMDGKPKINNLLRGHSAGLENKIRYLAKRNVNFHIRSTLTKTNINNFPEAIEWWANLRVKLIHFEVVDYHGRAEKNQILPPDNQLLFQAISRAVEMAEKKKIYLMHSSWMNLKNPSNYFCSSCRGLQCILLPDGQISSCYAVIDDNSLFKNFIIGKLDSRNKIQWNPNKNILNSINVDKMIPCRTCEVKKICSGGCLAKHWQTMGSLLTPSPEYCERKKLMIKIARDYARSNFKSILGFEYLNKRR